MRRDAHRLARLLRPGSTSDKAATLLRSSQELLANRTAWQPDVSVPNELPIAAVADDITAAIREHQVVVVAGETGSGKTTQLPKLCWQAGLGRRGSIGHTQPRRLAARTVAGRIAQEMGCALGDQVGYAVRFSDQVGPQTCVKVMTDGWLLAEIPNDRWLNQYDVLIVDEAHERSLNIDFLLGYLHDLLQRRKDLKLIVTSATIDVGAFAEHFGAAPVIEVSGRGYPVQVEYRDPADIDGGVQEMLARCLEDAAGRRAGAARDTLVFLPGEREIFDTAAFLRKRLQGAWDVLPLYARLPAAEQQRVFTVGPTPKVVLATNVAETSLTVPGIGFVIDLGTARISRYSYRSKLQRLQVEAISQASAKQRAGRCGRIGPGVCYRLYAEEDFVARQEYTDPEILRTNLAAVVLQMQAFGLGDIERFAFLEAPEPGAIRAAKRLLDELGALREDKVTAVGKRMARLPIDPRLARMLIEAQRLGALTELAIIVSGLAVADPRERPREKQAQADAAHEQFNHERSEFMSWLNLWQWSEAARADLTRRRYERRLKENFLSPTRMREWRSLHRQLVLACRGLKMGFNPDPANYTRIHCALLSGSLSFIGVHDERGWFLGPRGVRFRVFPGSPLARQKLKWLLAAEIVETSAVYARQVAAVEPAWIEEQAQHLLKRVHSEPHWSLKRGQVMAYEKVSVFGLVLRDRKRVPFGNIDPVVARELFLREALVQGQVTETVRRKWAFLVHNDGCKQAVLEQEAKSRRRDLMIPEDEHMALYAARVPEPIVDVAGLDQWLRRDPNNDARLRLRIEDLQGRQAPDLSDYPSSLALGDVRYPLRYRFAPGEADDGVSLEVPLGQLNALPSEALAWSVPGLFPLVVEHWLRALPKAQRKRLAPVPDKIPAVVARLCRPDTYRRGRLLPALSQVIADLYEVRIAAADWTSALPEHLLMNVVVMGEGGKRLAQGRELAALQAQFRQQLEATIESGVNAEFEMADITKFPPQLTLQERQSFGSGAAQVVGFPAFVDQGGCVALKVLPEASDAKAKHQRGLARLALLHIGTGLKGLRKEVQADQALQLHYATLGSAQELFDDLTLGLAWHLFFEGQPLPQDAQAFAACIEAQRARFTPRFRRLLAHVRDILQRRSELLRRLDAMTSPAYVNAVADARRQLQELVPGDLVEVTPSQYLEHIPRFLDALAHRLDHLQGRIDKDAAHIQRLQKLGERLARLREKDPGAAYVDLFFLLQELRVALFAERLKQGKVSPKRVEAALLAAEQDAGLA